MTDNVREMIALFCFALISPILNEQVINQKEYLAKVHIVPYYGPKEYVPKTIHGWLRDYHQGGFNALSLKDVLIAAKAIKFTLNLKINYLRFGVRI